MTSCWILAKAKTLVRKELVPAQKLVKGEIDTCCANGDIITYPIAEVEVEIGGQHYIVEASMVDKLPVSVLLGWDNPDLEALLQHREELEQEAKDVMAVTTCAQKKTREEAAAIKEEKERKSEAVPNPVQEETRTQEEGAADIESSRPGAEFAEELFSGGRTKPRKTRREKCEHKLRNIRKDTH